MSKIIPLMSRGVDSNAYLIQDEKIVLIDTGTGLDDRIKREADRLGEVDIIINTHAHFDHCGGNMLFEDAEIYLHRDDAKELVSGRFYGTYEFYDEKRPTKFHHLLVDGDKLDLGDHILEVVHSPGHTHGSICLFEKDKGILFSGDTIFPDGGFGRLDLGGNPEEMLRSLERVSLMNFDILYPGHGEVVANGREQAELSLMNARMFIE